jgi:hypothetical protein
VGLLLGAIFEDREHFNLAAISKFLELRVEFSMAARQASG